MASILRDGLAGGDIAAADAMATEARGLVMQLDPVGVGARDLRECLLLQVGSQRREYVLMLERRARHAQGVEADAATKAAEAEALDGFTAAAFIISDCLTLLQKKDMRELTRACKRTADQVAAAVDLIRKLDPRPGQRYNQTETRLIEPDVAFVRRGR